MPSSKEIVSNRALSGPELAKLIRADFEKLLDGEGLLSAQMAYGRVSYDLRIRLHMANPHHPESEISIASRARAKQEIEADPNLAVVEAPPLASPPDDSVVAGVEAAREITSPNMERIRTGEPIPVSVKQMDGTVSTQHIKYPQDPDAGEGAVTVRDVTEETLAEWKVEQGTAPVDAAGNGMGGQAVMADMNTSDPT